MSQHHPPEQHPSESQPAGAGDTRPDPTTPEPGHESERRRLRRSKEDRVIAGICGGLGRYLDMDPVLFRIAFIVLLIPGGLGLLVYIIGWIAIPEFRSAEEERFEHAARPVNRGMAGLLVGGTLIALGVLVLLRQLLPWFDIRVMGALVLIAIGAVVVIRGMQRD